ncbi:MAG: imidazole glycerol phosphate synthase subunit HisF [Planctomycetaceae bacterium]|nr:imidazole glycerol phosphate synthase subunit HisF [Planctomycetaceae bacterium]
MITHRVIPVLLLQDQALVKTRRFRQPTYVGDPINAIRIFNEKEVDELFLIDIAASREHREPDYKLLHDCASECFMPLGYGGGISSLSQATRLFDIGIEKVSLQTSTLETPQLVEQVAARYGNQAVVASVDVRRDWRGRIRLWSARQQKALGQNWKDHLRNVQALGAGEVLLNCVHRDGTREGYDCEIIAEAATMIDIPIIAIGGAGSIQDLPPAVAAGASALGAGSMFVFEGPHRAVLISYPSYQELTDALSRWPHKTGCNA